MTNIAIIVTMFLATNSVTYIHPSGVEGFRTNVVYQCFMTQTNDLIRESFTNKISVATNVERMTWLDVITEPKTNRVARKPLSIPDVVNVDTPPLPPQ